jgi:hypothetical protein
MPLIESVTVGPARVESVVRVPPDMPLRTSSVPGLAVEILELLPGVRRHRCECDSARGVVAELADTEIAHLLEHIALEMMALAGSPRSLAGETRWDFAADGMRVFRVSIDYDDDLVALGALREAEKVVESLVCGKRDTIDVDAAVAHLLSVRATGV